MKKERENLLGIGKNPPHRNYKQTKGKIVFSLYAAKLSNWTTLSIDLIENFSLSNSAAILICSCSALYTLPPPLFCCGYIITDKNKKVKYFCTIKICNICIICTKNLESHIFAWCVIIFSRKTTFCVKYTNNNMYIGRKWLLTMLISWKSLKSLCNFFK